MTNVESSPEINGLGDYMQKVFIWNVNMQLTGRGMNQQALCAPLGLKKGAVSAKMTGKTTWTIQDIAAVAEFLNVSPLYLLDATMYEQMMRGMSGDGGASLVAVATAGFPVRPSEGPADGLKPLETKGSGPRYLVETGGHVGIALAHVLQRQADGYAAQVLPAIEAVHHLVHVQGIVLDVGGDTPDAVCDQRAMNVAGHGLLHDAALVVLLLGPRVGEEGPYLGHGAGRGHLEQLGRIDLGPCALQAIVQTSGAAYEGEHLVQGVRRCLGVVCAHRGDGIDCCGFGIGHIFLGFSLCAAPLFIH